MPRSDPPPPHLVNVGKDEHGRHLVCITKGRMPKPLLTEYFEPGEFETDEYDPTWEYLLRLLAEAPPSVPASLARSPTRKITGNAD